MNWMRMGGPAALLVVLGSGLAGIWPGFGAGTGAATLAAKTDQYLYVLRIVPAYHKESDWTDAHKTAVREHFVRLKQATDAGQVILAGKTSEPLEKTFGLVIFEADDEAQARAFMENDPAVKAGLMSATLHPYAVALQRKP